MVSSVQSVSAYALGSYVLAESGFDVLGADNLGADVMVRFAPPEVAVRGVHPLTALGFGALALGILSRMTRR